MRTLKSWLNVEALEARTVPTAGLDWTFGHAGRTFVPFPGDYGGVYESTTDSTGRTLVLRQLNNGLAVIRLTADGKLDDTFGDHGVASFQSEPPPPYPMPVEPNGGIGDSLPVEPNGGNGSSLPVIPYFYPVDFAVDGEGHVCVATISNGGITSISPDGARIEHFPLPDPLTTNVCFGGPDLRTAYATLSGTGRLVAFDWPRPGLRLPF